MAHTWTWDKLVKNATRLNPKSRGKNSPYTPKFEMQKFSSGPNRGKNVVVPFIGTKSVLINLRAWGVTQASLHNVTLLFSGVDIKTEDPKSYRYFQIQYDGQMYWISKLDKFRNPLTFRCTCFTGDTKILLADGTTKSFKELEGQEFEVNCYDYEQKQFKIAIAGNSSIKQENADIIELTFSDGSKVKCTPDHKFHLVNNLNEKTVCEAIDILGKTVKCTFKDLQVVDIKPAGKEDVYCITVPEFGNFCLENGAVVENCKDFFYTWAWPASKVGHCLYGPPPKPYKRKTTWMAPRNPNNIIGCCKHIVNAWKVLADSGITIN